MARTVKRAEASEAPKLGTAHGVMNALRDRYAKPASAWAVLECVANGTGSKADRWADAIAMSVWPSRGLEIHGIEIKVSRSDLLRELKDPRKAEAVAGYCDFWWVAVGSTEICDPSELPSAWGLLVPKALKDGATMVVAKEAKQLDPKPLDRGFLASILRRASERYDVSKIEQNVRNQIWREIHDEVGARVQESHQREIDMMKGRADALQKTLDETKAQLATATSSGFDPRMLGEAMKLLSLLQTWPSAEQTIRNTLEGLQREAVRLDAIRKTLEQAQTITGILTGKQPRESLADDPVTSCTRQPAVAG